MLGVVSSDSRRLGRNVYQLVYIIVFVYQALGEVCPWLFVSSDVIHTLLVLTSEKSELIGMLWFTLSVGITCEYQ